MTPILMQTWSTQMSEHAHIDGVHPFPALMQTRTIETNGTSIHVRVGGHGPAVVMLNGFGTTGDMWGHLANRDIALSTTTTTRQKPLDRLGGGGPIGSATSVGGAKRHSFCVYRRISLLQLVGGGHFPN